MQVVCEATQNSSAQVQVAAFECLVRIMGLYYDKMALYMEQALFGVREFGYFYYSHALQLTVVGMKHPDERVAMQAIEFWSTVCEEEIDLAIELQEVCMRPHCSAVRLITCRPKNMVKHLRTNPSSLPKSL